MTGSWMEPDAEILLRAAGALRQFLWQGAAIGALFAVADALLVEASPRVRYAAGCAALALMLAAPAATFAGMPSRVRDSRIASPAASTSAAASPASAPAAAPGTSPSHRGGAHPDPLAPWIVGAWLAGVTGLSLRLVAACLAVDRLRRRRSRSVPPALEARLAAIASRMGVTRTVRLLESASVRIPGVVGALRPAVLLPVGIASGLTAGQMDALLAHELAHVARRDYLVHLVQAFAETLLFFHPAVWWVSHRIRVERELVCDDLAVAATGDALLYARALLAVEERRLAPAAARLAMAADGGGGRGGAGLSARIRRLAGRAPARASAPAPWIAGVLALSSALALGAAARTREITAIPRPATSAEPSAAGDASAAAPAIARPAEIARPFTAPEPAATPEPPRPAAHPQTAPAPARTPVATLSPDDLIAFRIHGVTPEFVESIRAEGYDHAAPDDLLALRIHGVTPAYIRDMTKVLGRQPLEEYVAFRIHGLTPESVGELRASFARLSADDALALRIHGATPEFVREMRGAGFASLSADDAIAFRIHGVTPEFVHEMKDLGLSGAGLSADDAVAFRIHGVTPEFVRELRGLGYAALSAEDLTDFRIHGLTPEAIRKLNARAGRRLSPDELIERRIHGDDEEDFR